jgi:hypothetical protein
MYHQDKRPLMQSRSDNSFLQCTKKQQVRLFSAQQDSNTQLGIVRWS